MNAKIRRVKIEYLFGYKNIDMVLDDVTVLVGDNGTGKSTILRIIHSLLTLNETDSLKLCKSAELWIDDDIKIAYENFYDDDSRVILEHIFVDTINSNEISVSKMDSDDIPVGVARNLAELSRDDADRLRRRHGESG
jgi:predicted ATPase